MAYCQSGIILKCIQSRVPAEIHAGDGDSSFSEFQSKYARSYKRKCGAAVKALERHKHKPKLAETPFPIFQYAGWESPKAFLRNSEPEEIIKSKIQMKNET